MFHGKKELFGSNHVDAIEAETILQKCEIHNLSMYRVIFSLASHQLSLCCKLSRVPRISLTSLLAVQLEVLPQDQAYITLHELDGLLTHY